ncbi:MAG: TonB family protein [Cyclobacteriaceae bacterium]
MTRFITAIICAILWVNLHAQQNPSLITDTIYYTNNWGISGKGNFVYYRIATFHPDSMYFVGPFVDYYASGAILEKGQYDDEGAKTGHFTRYYNNGYLYSEGSFVNNEALGDWLYYYRDGALREKISFSESDYTVVDYFNPAGKQKVRNGTGKWKFSLRISGYRSPYMVGVFEKGEKIGEWKVRDETSKMLMKEIYNGGVFRHGVVIKEDDVESYTEPIISKKSLMANNHKIIEAFRFNDWVTQEQYPYFKSRPRNREEVLSRRETKRQRSAKPVGGMSAFYRRVGSNLNYPHEARRSGIEGRVYVSFIVKKDGTLADLRVVKGIGGGCDEEAVRVIAQGPKWIPPVENGDTLEVSMVLPLIFRLTGSKPQKVKPSQSATTIKDLPIADEGDEIFTIVQDNAEPEGGMETFYEYVKQNLVYPEEARKKGVAGRVYVQLVVEKDGSISNMKVAKGLGLECDKEAYRLVKSYPAWKVGKQRGENVRQRIILPVVFKL